MVGSPPRAVLGRVAASWLLIAGLLAPSVLAGVASDGGQGAGAAGANPGANPGADLARPHVDGVVLVGYTDTATESDRAAARESAGAASAQALSRLSTRAEKLSLAPGASVERAIAALKSNPKVRYAEPDYIVTREVTSNDPYYTNGSLWGMYGDSSPDQTNIFGSGAAEAWDSGYTGSRDIAIGVIDEGIQFTHPDLVDNIWTNPGEIAGNGIDDDRNGFIDDIHGWDFFADDASIFDGDAGSSVDAHGTHVSGTIGGDGGNGTGVAGVNWQVTIISAKFLGPSGGAISDAVAALDYLVDLKVNRGVNLLASSNSWGGGGFSQTMLDSINRAGNAGMLFIAAAGNSNSNNDTKPSYPSSYTCTNGGTRGWDCVVAVAAIDSSGNRASFSSYGATSVDLGAPGVGVWSSVPLNSYASYNGTSMATPHVSGAAALCASINPALSVQQIRAALVSSAAATPSMTGTTVTGGRLDVGSMVARCLPSTAPVDGGGTGLAATGISPTRIALSWTDGASNESAWKIQRSPAGCGTFTTIATTLVGTTSFTVTGLQASTSYCFQVQATNSFEGGSQSGWSATANGTTQALPPPYTCATTLYAWIDATSGGTSLTLSDDSALSSPLGFSFTFYGEPVTTAQVSSNGYLVLGTGGATAYANVAIPNAADPNAMIAAFWDDLNPGAGGSVWTMTTGSAPNRKFVAAWVNVPHFSVTGSTLTFEIVLDEATGAITIQYQDAVAGNATYDNGASATAGVENLTGSAGTQIASSTASLANFSAWRCTSTNSATSPTITPTSFPDGTVEIAYNAGAAATGGQTPYTWSIIDGALPAGLGLNATTGAITGTPTAAGTAGFTLQVQGNDGAASSTAFSIRVVNPLSITTAALANGAVGAAYSATLVATGGQTAYAWLIIGDPLPAGLTLDTSNGTISGTPTTAATASFTVGVTDAGNPTRSDTQGLSITVSGAVPGAFNKTLPKNNAKLAASTAAALTWGPSFGASSYEYCVSRTNGSCTTWINVGPDLSVGVTGLTPKTNYWWQVRAVNGSVTTLANSGTLWKFTTKA